MIKLILATVISLCIYGQAHAAELNPSNIVGKYKVLSKVGFQKIYLNFRVLDTREFEIQRTYPNGKVDEVCNGTYRMNHNLLWNLPTLAVGHTFKGVITCPSNRSKNIDFDIDFKNKTTTDLINGTTVTVNCSLIPGYAISSYVKKQ
jgi:hypothetical protein